MDNELLVKSIRKLCKNNNVPVSQLENDLNFGAGLISRWNKSSPSLDKIVDIADYFHVSIDEVVGYKNSFNDVFLNKLYQNTSDGTISWENGEVMNDHGQMVKLYSRFYEPGKHIKEDYEETTYAVQFNNGYIVINAYHHYNNILNPEDVMLFIQPSDEDYLVEQYYTKDELLGLWIKVLNSLGDDTPSEVKAESMKNDFINHTGKYDKIADKLVNFDFKSMETIEKFLTPELQRDIQFLNSESFKSTQKLMSNKEFIKAVQNAQNVRLYMKTNNEDK